MAELVVVPQERVAPDTLRALLEEYASRDGTDYGYSELSLEEKTEDLRLQLHRGELLLCYDGDSEHWDLVTPHRWRELQGGDEAGA